MTLGEKIQIYRKQLGMSQEELGQKMFVSRQTISLWEKDQTVPTIDNLIRLRDIFGVSIDEILDVGEHKKGSEPEPSEAYQFHYDKTELKKIYRLQSRNMYIKTACFICICIFLIVLFISSSAPDAMIGLVFGMLYMGVAFYIKGVRTYYKNWKKSTDRICASTYEYKLFEDYMEINIYRENEKIRASKCYYKDIEQIQQFGDWLFLCFGGQSFLVRRSDLKENSAFYSYMYNNPSKTVEAAVQNKWRIISNILFVASILSIMGALALVNAFSSANGLSVENMWLFFLMTPIPIASIVFGCILKSKGYRYKKNIIVGVIMTILLCLYGSFAFIFKQI